MAGQAKTHSPCPYSEPSEPPARPGGIPLGLASGLRLSPAQGGAVAPGWGGPPGVPWDLVLWPAAWQVVWPPPSGWGAADLLSLPQGSACWGSWPWPSAGARWAWSWLCLW